MLCCCCCRALGAYAGLGGMALLIDELAAGRGLGREGEVGARKSRTGEDRGIAAASSPQELERKRVKLFCLV